MNFEKNIEKIEAAIGYTFRDKALLRQAFTRTSFCNEHKGRGGVKFQSNEVLEFIGDSVLGSAIITLLMREHAERYAYGIRTKLNEGDFSNIKSRLSDKKNLSRSMAELGLAEYLLLGEGDAKLGIYSEPSVMEDLFESIIGAIYLDSGEDLSKVLTSCAKMLDVREYMAGGEPPMQSFKNAIQEWCADKRHRRPAPIYKTVSEEGPDHKKLFTRACCIGDKIYGTGIGKNQKIADSLAAEAALLALQAEEDRAESEKALREAALAMTKLREHAKKNKKTSPEFKDLGETERSTEKRPEFCVECRYFGISCKGTGFGKREARDDAASKLWRLLCEEEAPKKAKEEPKKSARKRNTGADSDKKTRPAGKRRNRKA